MTPGWVPSRRQRIFALVAGAIVLAWPMPYLDAIRSPNELVRVYLARAIVDEGTICIDHEVERHGNLTDMAARDGHLYSDKAPGLSFLGAPIYATLRLFRAADAITNRALVLGLRFALIVVPTIVWMLVLSKWLSALQVPEDLVAMGPLAYALATPAFAYCLAFMGHQASAWMIGIAMAAAWMSRSGSAMGRAVSGLLAASAAVTEYPTAPMIGAIALLALSGASRPWRGLLSFGAGAALPLALTAAYHTAAFGGPMTTGYSFLVNPGFRDVFRIGVMGISFPSPTALWELTLGTKRGLLALTPWLALAPIGLATARSRPYRLLVAVLAFDVALHVWVATGYQYWEGGWSAGPRHLVPALPALTLLAIFGWATLRARASAADVLCRGLLAASVIVMGVVCITFPAFPEELNDPLFDLTLPMVADHQFSASVPHMLGVRSDVAMVPAIVVGFGVMLWLAAGSSDPRRAWPSVMWRLGGALWIALAFLIVRAEWREPPTCDAVFRAAWLRQIVWEPTDVERPFDSRPARSDEASLALRRGEVEPEAFGRLGAVNAYCGQFREALRDYVLAASASGP